MMDTIPTNKDNGLAPFEIREASDKPAIILSNKTQSAIDKILQEHRQAIRLRGHEIQPSQKILLCGPPSCGKTMAAEFIARKLTLPIASISLDSVFSSFSGETAANLREIFYYLENHTVVAIFKKFDAAPKDHDDSADQKTFLQMMDGYRGESILIATTNCETILDKRIWRYFDEVVHFDLPDFEQINHLFKMRLGGLMNFSEEAKQKFVTKFNGMSYADIERVIKRAIKEMVLSNQSSLEVKHIEAAYFRDVFYAHSIRNDK